MDLASPAVSGTSVYANGLIWVAEPYVYSFSTPKNCPDVLFVVLTVRYDLWQDTCNFVQLTSVLCLPNCTCCM